MSHQATIVIQAQQDKRDIVERYRIANDKNINKKQYHIYIGAGATLDTGTIRIDRGDLVFMVGTSIMPRGNMLNGAPCVSSFLNGLVTRREYGDVARTYSEIETNLKLSEGIRFIGVSLGETTPNPEDGDTHTKNQITVRTHGSMTIFNNSDNYITPGETLLWKIPTRKEVAEKSFKRYGRQPNKVTLQIVPLRKVSYANSVKNVFQTKDLTNGEVSTVHEQFAYDLKKLAVYMLWSALTPDADKKVNPATGRPDVPFDEVWQFFDKDYGPVSGYGLKVGPIEKNITKNLDEMFKNNDNDVINGLVDTAIKSFLNIQHDIERRKIGKALSFSKPGTGVDVLLGNS